MQVKVFFEIKQSQCIVSTGLLLDLKLAHCLLQVKLFKLLKNAIHYLSKILSKPCITSIQFSMHDFHYFDVFRVTLIRFFSVKK